jgi:membrane protein
MRIRHSASTLWKDLVSEFSESRLLTVASSLAYTTLLSLIPLLAVSFAIFQAFGGLEKLYATVEPFIMSNLAEGSSEDVIQHIRRFIGNVHAGTIGAGGFIGLLVTSISLLFSIEKAINQIWKAPNTRSWFSRIASYWFFITLGPLALSIAVGFVTSEAMPLAKALPGGTGMFLLASGFFFWLFKAVPNRVVHWRPALISSLATSAGWNLARIAYQFYTAKLVSYNKIYGSLGAIPILLLWIYVVWVIVLTGVVVTSVLQKRFGIR